VMCTAEPTFVSRRSQQRFTVDVSPTWHLCTSIQPLLSCSSHSWVPPNLQAT
jgi:hypothetical protein